MTNYYIKSFSVQKLWGYRDLNLTFEKDVNIIIGPNASGKTTILNLIRYIFTADILNLRGIAFDNVEIVLKSFENKPRTKIVVLSQNEGYKFTVGNHIFDIELDPILRNDPKLNVAYNSRIAKYRFRNIELENAINEIVGAVWLPVSRRLPIPDDEDIRPNYAQLESVDARLRDLIKEIKTYRLGLEQKLSLQYKNFEKSVLREILYSKPYDQLGTLSMSAPTDEDKEQLTRAFQVAGLLDYRMQARIDEHFNAASQALKDFEKFAEKESDGQTRFPIDFLL